MNILLTIIRTLTAIISPLVAITLLILAHLKLRGVHGESPEEGETCLGCGQAEPGDIGVFHYAESVGSPRDRTTKKQLTLASTPILGSETHFICDRCARRFIKNETIQTAFLLLPYPLYLYVIIPLFAKDGVFANFLIETLLLVITVAAFTSAYDLFRAVRNGASPLAEARDRVAISKGRALLGKKFSYYTRIGATHLGDRR
jgi:hypothetical protein